MTVEREVGSFTAHSENAYEFGEGVKGRRRARLCGGLAHKGARSHSRQYGHRIVQAALRSDWLGAQAAQLSGQEKSVATGRRSFSKRTWQIAVLKSKRGASLLRKGDRGPDRPGEFAYSPSEDSEMRVRVRGDVLDPLR